MIVPSIAAKTDYGKEDIKNTIMLSNMTISPILSYLSYVMLCFIIPSYAIRHYPIVFPYTKDKPVSSCSSLMALYPIFVYSFILIQLLCTYMVPVVVLHSSSTNSNKFLSQPLISLIRMHH